MKRMGFRSEAAELDEQERAKCVDCEEIEMCSRRDEEETRHARNQK